METLDELAKRDDHSLYPFVSAWNPKLIEVAGIGFEKIQEFKDKIVEKLRYKWVEIERSEDAIYYDGLIKFRDEYAHPLRIFTLNYDLCLEKACQRVLGEYPQRGFEDRKWDWRLFDDTPDNNIPIFLYKLHGSTDWKIETDNTLTYKDSISSIDSRDVAIIFGTTYKLQYVDPFLFLVYEFRRWTLEAKLILTIGYGFLRKFK